MAETGEWLQRPARADSVETVSRLGALLKAHRDAESLTQTELGQLLGIDQSYVSQIERGKPVRNVDLLLQISDFLKIPPSQLGLSDQVPRIPAQPDVRHGAGLAKADQVQVSQDRWRAVRQYLNQHRSDLAQVASSLYESDQRLQSTSLVAPASWLPAEPVPLENVTLTLSEGPRRCKIDGSEPESQLTRPLRAPGKQYERYTSAIRYIDAPRLFENRTSYRLLGLNWSGTGGAMTLGIANYFDKLDISEAVGHELAMARLNRHGSHSIGWDELPFRALVGDPFDCARRAVIPAITTLTLRRRRTHGTASFLLHWRDPTKVATASGLYDVIPAGEFQPSSMAPWDLRNDFDLWRNIVRELSEELLGTPEHDGTRSAPIDYDGWSFYRSLQDARKRGELSVYCLGVALDALTLAATILTVLVIDDTVFDDLFGERVQTNAEGQIVSVADGEGIPFTDANVSRLLNSEPMASPGAGCLALAWRHRGLLLAPHGDA